METLDQLKEIVKNAPSGKTMVSECYGVHYYWNNKDLSSLSMRCESVYGVIRSLSDINDKIELLENNQKLLDKINQFDKAITDIGKHIQKSEPSFCMSGVDIGDSQSKIIGYIKKLEAALQCDNKGDS